MIPYGRQDVQDDDIEAVLEVLRSDFLTQGPAVQRFEQAVINHCNVGHAVAVNSATSALHIALLALDVGLGDIVWTSPNTFVASSNAALYCGADVDFVDIDNRTYNMCPQALSKKLAAAKQIGKLPKVVIPVHLTGQSCDMEGIRELSRTYGFKIVEDASHAIGGLYKGQPVGNCAFSDITVFSFHPVKIVTSGEGGMALTNNDELAHKMLLYRSHGVTRDSSLMTQEPDGPWYYQQLALGYNYRMSDLQAALGASQMKRLDSYVSRRHEIAEVYNNLLADLPVTRPFHAPYSHSSYHLYVIRLNLNMLKPLTHLEIFQHLRDCNILVNLHYIPVHTQPFYQKMGFSWGDFPNAEAYYKEAISLPIYPKLTKHDQIYVINALHEVLKK